MNRLFCNILCYKRKVQQDEFRLSRNIQFKHDSAAQLKLACFAVPERFLSASLLALMLPGCEAAARQKKQQDADVQNQTVVARHAAAQRAPT